MIADAGADDFYTALIDVDKIDDRTFEAISRIVDGEDPTVVRKSFLGGVEEYDKAIAAVIPNIASLLSSMRAADDNRKRKHHAEKDREASWRSVMMKTGAVPEAPDSAPFGAFAFPQHRVGNLPPEPDTDIESNAYEAIDSHFNYGSGGIQGDVAQALMLCLQNGWYADVLQPPKHDTIYRGLRVSLDWIEEHVPDYDGALVGESKRPLMYRSRESSSSWSVDENIAWQWAGRRNLPGVVLVARTSDNRFNMLDGSRLYKTLPRLARYSSESEVVGLGDVKCIGVKWRVPNTRSFK